MTCYMMERVAPGRPREETTLSLHPWGWAGLGGQGQGGKKGTWERVRPMEPWTGP